MPAVSSKYVDPLLVQDCSSKNQTFVKDLNRKVLKLCHVILFTEFIIRKRLRIIHVI